jgi:hypothetical protein
LISTTHGVTEQQAV